MKTPAILALATLLAACATTCQPEGISGGFSETQLDINLFRVSFSGNGYTSSERAEDFALLRSAELALRNGFSHFLIVQGRASTYNTTVTTPSYSSTIGTATLRGNTISGSATTTTYAGQVIPIAKPSMTNTILMLREKPTENFAYDAGFIVRSLSKKYGLTLALPQ